MSDGEKHDAIIEESFAGNEASVSCSCGWESGRCDSVTTAHEALKDHRAVSARDGKTS